MQLSAPLPSAQVLDRGNDQQALEARSQAKRKAVQAEHQREYEEAVVLLKAKVKDLEGQDMRETIQDKVGPPLSFLACAAACPQSLHLSRQSVQRQWGWGCQHTQERCSGP